MGWIKDIFDIFTAMIRSDISDRETFFDKHVEPLYEKLTQIHKDYIIGLQDVRAKIKSGSFTNEELISFIRDRRREYGLERQLTYALANELSSAESMRFSGNIGSSVEEYCHAICGYFLASRVGKIGDTHYSEMISLLEAKQEISEHIDIIIEKRLPQAFNEVTSAYAKLKVGLL